MEAGRICLDALMKASMHGSMTARKLVIDRIWRAMKACLYIIKISKVVMQQRERDRLQAAIIRSYRNNMHSERHADGESDVMRVESCIPVLGSRQELHCTGVCINSLRGSQAIETTHT